MKNILIKSLLYAMPIALLFAIMGAPDVALQLKHYYKYTYYSINDLYLICFFVLFGISCVLLSLPIMLSLKSNSKNKGWIIFLATICFLPFGVIFYLASLIWAICEWGKTATKNLKTSSYKSEIVNNNNYLSLKKADRINHLQNLKNDSITELQKKRTELETQRNKFNDIPTDIAKYAKTTNASDLTHKIKTLENKMENK